MAQNPGEPLKKKKNGRGRPFLPNNCANPGGRPKALGLWRKSPEAQRLRDLSYAALEDALGEEQDTKDRIAAARELLDRIEGRPIQMVTGEDGGPIRLDIESLTSRLKQIAGEDVGESS